MHHYTNGNVPLTISIADALSSYSNGSASGATILDFVFALEGAEVRVAAVTTEPHDELRCLV